MPIGQKINMKDNFNQKPDMAEENYNDVDEKQQTPVQEESTSSHGEELKALGDKLGRLEEENLLAMAENENLRKRSCRQIEEAHSFAITKFAKDMVETLDDLYRASENFEDKGGAKSYDVLLQGLTLTKSNLEKNLKKYGIERLYPKEQKFDYKFHEALSQVPDDKFEEDTVLDVVQAGYKIKDRMLKSAKVIVTTASKK